MSPRAREESMRPQLQSGASMRPLNFTVRRHVRALRLTAVGILASTAWLAQSSGAEPVSPWYVGSTWSVMVYDAKHQAIGSMTLRVTNERAASCIGGDWKRLVIVKRQFKEADSFLATKPLSYSLEGSKLTFGVTEVCDGYVFLSGAVTDARVAGDYGTLGLGGFTKLGTFSAARVQANGT